MASAPSHGPSPVGRVVPLVDVSRLHDSDGATTALAARLEERNRLLTMAEALAGLGHWRLDTIDNSLFWSDEVYRIYGRTPLSPPILADALSGYHPDDVPAITACVEAAQRDGTPWTLEARILRPDGEVRHVATSGQVERDDDGTIVGLFGIFQDVTARKEAEARLTEARDEAQRLAAAKSAFLATMSHEIRTPMTGVLGMIELLRSEPPPAERARFFDSLQQSASLLMAVLDDILDFSKLESRALLLEEVDFDMRDLARNTLDLFGSAAAKKGLRLVLSAPAGEPDLARGDSVRMQQILSNLISNAIKFTEHGAVEVRITADAAGSGRRRWRVAVQDTGIGIAADDVAPLFEPFVQADASTTRRFGGTGLGLAISKRLVTAMGGTIGVESRPGQGATFWFEVDLAVGRGPAEPAKASVGVEPGRRLSILVAEDNPINQALIAALIERDGHAVTCVPDGVRAVEAAAAARYDLVLMDMQMPEMDGLAATAAIRAGDGPCRDVPIVALTADASPERRPLYDSNGLSGFMAKPVDTQALSRRLAALAATEPLVTTTTLPAVLDEDRLTELTGAIGDEPVTMLLDLLATEARTRPVLIADAVSRGDRDAAQRECHSLKGAASGVGAARLSAAARAIELASGAEALAPLIGALHEAARATLAALDHRTGASLA